MNTVLISIIIPTYNRAHLIGQTLDSILAQTYQNWECIIIDDGSTDNSAEIIDDYIGKDSRFQYHARPLNREKGPCSCRNYGFELSKGDWINWFDSDDIYVETALENFVSSIGSDLDAVIGKLVKVDSKTNEIVGYNRIFHEQLLEKYFTGFLSFYVCGPLWKREFLEKQKELFDEKMRFLDDWDFNLRMLYQRPKILFLDKVLFNYRIDANSLSHQIYALNEKEIESEIYAREKQLEIISKNKQVDYKTVLGFTRDRYRILLLDCLFNNNKAKKKMFLLLTKKNLLLGNFKSIGMSGVGYLSFIIFKRGSVFFK